MNASQIRLLVVDVDPSSGEDALRSQLDQVPGIELVGIAHSKRGALNQVESIKPDFMLVDLDGNLEPLSAL